MPLAQLTGDRPFLADAGLETVLVFLDGIELADFASFPLLDTADGRTALTRYYAHYLALAEQHGRGVVLDTPTWRASLDWGARLGYDSDRLGDVNRQGVAFVRSIAGGYPGVTTVVNGAVGPRGDGYVVEASMSADEARHFHALQARAFADAGADLMTAITMTYADEAIGVVRAAGDAGVAAAVSFTLETDGKLPSGQPLGDAIRQVDDATGGAPEYYLINCAHPTHFHRELERGVGSDWIGRIKGLRANASTLSHAELDEASELDRGDVAELAEWYATLGRSLDLRVVGGCCGTDHEHVDAIARATATARTGAA